MRARGMLAALPGLLPWILSALWTAFTPAQALLVAVALRHGPPRTSSGRELLHDFLALAAPAFVLHGLRPDASLTVLAAILLAGLLLEILRARPAGARAARILLAALLAGPVSLTFFCRLAECEPPALAAQADPWRLAAASPAPGARLEVAGQVWFAPERTEPWPLTPAADDGARQRGLLLLALVCAAAMWNQCQRNIVALLALLGAASGPIWLPPAPRTLLLEAGAAGPAVELELAAHFRGEQNWTWDPQRTAPPPGVRARLQPSGPVQPEAAWLERHPLQAPRQEGDAGALKLLAWYADADRPAGAVRWSLRADGLLVRRLLPL